MSTRPEGVPVEEAQGREAGGGQPPDLGEFLVSFQRSVQATTLVLMEPYGVSVEEFSMISALLARGPSSVTQVAHALGHEPARAGRRAYRLTQEGLLRSRRRRDDRRVVELRVTPRGEEVATAIGELLRDAYAELLRGTSDEDVERFVEVMLRIRENFHRMRGDNESNGGGGATVSAR